MSKKYVIIHGHFYQPPRENPWINVIETQPSAAPYHDWNERIYDQCYRPNACSRLLDANGRILDIHNNFLSMSFNFGPTLFSWLEQRHRGTLRRIIDADRESSEALDGHGNAIAQVYNHIIMPLAPVRDQLTQLRWAKGHFREKFRRDPEGIWLAETAINMDTVRCCIEENIRFVILSPTQAEAVRPLDGPPHWSPTPHGLDTRHPYRIYPADRSGNRLPGYVDAFFFDNQLSREASFGDLLKDAHLLGARINARYDAHAGSDQVVVLASDGETFGHHKPFGDMCLAYFFRKIAPRLGIHPVNFGYFLAKNPPRHEVLLKNLFGEGSAWSCAHGTGRWSRDCGCKTGGQASWKQAWRAPLRASLEELRSAVDKEFETALTAMKCDPWVLRDAYGRSIDDPVFANFMKLIEEHAAAPLTREMAMEVRRLLEAQKYMLFSFTSCGWFFSDVSGIETIQNLAYAARALQMGIPAERQKETLDSLCRNLDQARSNIPGVTGATLFKKEMPAQLVHEKVLAFTAAVQAVIGLVKTGEVRIFRYGIAMRDLCTAVRDDHSCRGFDVSIENGMTGEQGRWAVMVSHREWAEIQGWVVAAPTFGEKMGGSCCPEDWMNHPESSMFSIKDIFQPLRETMADYIHHNIFRDTYANFSGWMQKNEQVLDFLSRLKFPLPLYCLAPLSFVYNQQWNQVIARLERPGGEEKVFAQLGALCGVAERFGISIDFKECAGLLERIIIMELAALSFRLSAATCERIGWLCNIVDRFAVPISKNKIEDAFYPIVNGPIQRLYDEVVRLASAAGNQPPPDDRLLAEKRELLNVLVQFAGRMNFNTERFGVK